MSDQDPIEWEFGVPASQVDLKRLYDEYEDMRGRSRFAGETNAYWASFRSNAPVTWARFEKFLNDGEDGYLRAGRKSVCDRCGSGDGFLTKSNGKWFHILCIPGVSFNTGLEPEGQVDTRPARALSDAELDALQASMDDLRRRLGQLKMDRITAYKWSKDGPPNSTDCTPEQRPVIFEILEERNRQLEKGYTAQKDDALKDRDLSRMAVCHALQESEVWICPKDFKTHDPVKFVWPLGSGRGDYQVKNGPNDIRRELVIAAALLVAEIERFDQLNSKPT